MNEFQHHILDLQAGYTTLRRTAQHIKLYADACKELANALEITVVNIWEAFQKEAGWVEGEPLVGSLEGSRNGIFDELFSDGQLSPC